MGKEYILIFDNKEKEYVEDYNIGTKHVTVGFRKYNALKFVDRSVAEYVAEVMGCKVEAI
ncbi:hypothetical protein BEH_07480 [Priestia filamentosa]|uniref:Uncharacterized protein n=1 Tax=Priestia filamentosa TaxID=1402861 RepID=A0A0H4KI30_9BACI|nr:hypothetical protein [Priestia filamentosa]AKO91954.1 hypothetical protein BEH_07480 [Priestia filamentosa]